MSAVIIRCNITELSKHVSLINSILQFEYNNLLNNLFVKVTDCGLELRAYDGGKAFSSFISATSNKETSFVIDTGLLYNALRSCGQGDITIEIVDNSLCIKQDKTNITLFVNSDRIPSMYINNELEIGVKAITRIQLDEALCKQVCNNFQYLTTELIYTHIDHESGTLSLIGTSGTMLLSYTIRSITSYNSHKFTIPALFLKDLKKLLSYSKGNLTIEISPECLVISSGYIFKYKISTHNYLDYAAIITGLPVEHLCYIPQLALSDMLNKTSIFAKEKFSSCYLILDEQHIGIQAKSFSSGKAEQRYQLSESITTPRTLNIDRALLLQALSCFGKTEEVYLYYSDSNKALLLRNKCGDTLAIIALFTKR